MKNNLFGKLTETEANIIAEFWYNWQTAKTEEARKEKAYSLVTILHVFAIRHKTNIVTVWNWCFY